MKIKLALITLLLPAAVFAQAGKSGENAGYQGTTSATKGLGSANPNAGASQSQTARGGNSGATVIPNSGQGTVIIPPSTVQNPGAAQPIQRPSGIQK
jgi:hypothetical protein